MVENNHCELLKTFDNAYVNLMRKITKGDNEEAREAAKAWMVARDGLKQVIMDAKAKGDNKKLAMVNEVVKLSFDSLNGGTEERLENFKKYEESRKVVFKLVCAKGLISKIADAVDIRIGIPGITLDVKKLLRNLEVI